MLDSCNSTSRYASNTPGSHSEHFHYNVCKSSLILYSSYSLTAPAVLIILVGGVCGKLQSWGSWDAGEQVDLP